MIKNERDMIRNDSERLILEDMCARLPYNPVVGFYMFVIRKHKQVILRSLNPTEGTYRIGNHDYDDFSRIKPYLRPLSNMTADEKKIWSRILNGADSGDIFDHIRLSHISIESIGEAIDFLNSRYFDYRGLIGRGLAVEAPEGMYLLQ